jgi:7-cyano-7-deazaguanine synthase
MEQRALVLFSGGQDSATCLAWACARFGEVETLGFNYGQRHLVEMDQRPVFLDAFAQGFPHWAARLGADTVLDVATLGQVSETALTRETEIVMTEAGLPSTFVPGRNLIFLTYAAALAYRRGIKHIITGVCETDYSGYPDCRDDTIKALQVALNLGLETRLVLHTPLMWIDKPATTGVMAAAIAPPAICAPEGGRGIGRWEQSSCGLPDPPPVLTDLAADLPPVQ